MAFCTKCGSKNPEDAKFCTSCGEKIMGSSTAADKTDFSQAKNLADLKNNFLKDGVSIKEIIFTIAAYFILIAAFYWVGREIFDNFNLIGSIFNRFTNFSDPFEGIFLLIISFTGYYLIALFVLKDKKNLNISVAAISFILLVITVADVYEFYENLTGLADYMHDRSLKPGIYQCLVLAADHDVMKIVAFLMAICKITIKPNNTIVPNENADDPSNLNSEKNLLIGYGIIGCVACVLIFISPYFLVGAIVILALKYRKK